MNAHKRIVCIIQARTGSTRLPNKIFLDLLGIPVLGQVIERIQASFLIDDIVIASPNTVENDCIEEFVLAHYPTVGVYRGSEHDVLDRYYQAAKHYGADIVIRITSDCPLIDPQVVDRVIQSFLDQEVDYAANILGTRTFPRGLDTEVFSFETLEHLWQEAIKEDEREHVTLYLRKHPEIYSTYNVVYKKDYSAYRITLDTQEDYELIHRIYRRLYPDNLGMEAVVHLLSTSQELIDINKHIQQKYGQY